jgi:hypothetical protein
MRYDAPMTTSLTTARTPAKCIVMIERDATGWLIQQPQADGTMKIRRCTDDTLLVTMHDVMNDPDLPPLEVGPGSSQRRAEAQTIRDDGGASSDAPPKSIQDVLLDMMERFTPEPARPFVRPAAQTIGQQIRTAANKAEERAREGRAKAAKDSLARAASMRARSRMRGMGQR